MRTIYLDGRYLKVKTPLTEVFKPGCFKGKGVFETMLGLDGAVMDTGAHLARMRTGLRNLGIRPPSIKPTVLNEVLRRNHLSSARVRLMVWQSSPRSGQAPPQAGQTGKEVHVMIMALPYKSAGRRIYRVCLVKTSRSANACFADVKSLDRGIFAKSHALACARGFDEALLLNAQGHIFEASRANIFWTKNNVLYTPGLSSGCLNGITRRQVIKQAKRLGIPLEEKVLTPEILKIADAAFLTNSLIGIKPIEIKKISIVSARH